MTNSPFSIANVRLFVLFRVLFNARFYYPVFTVLFLDFGLSLEQFAILNSVWAATIVLLEVPSGALADTLGRRNLLRVTGVLMIVEMLILCFVPLGNVDLIFWALLVNRILSGAAEAAASGADEALAFDSLADHGMTELWPRVLEVQMRVQSLAFIGALVTGSLVYDASVVNSLLRPLGIGPLTGETTMRFPLYLVLASSIGVLYAAIRMKEVRHKLEPPLDEGKHFPVTFTHEQTCDVRAPDANGKPLGFWAITMGALKTTLGAGSWILKSRMALLVICGGVVFDNIIRMVLTLNSQYYRSIDLPEWSFGIFGGILSVAGVFVPTLAKKLVISRSPRFVFGVLVLLCFTGLYGMTFVWPWLGLIPTAFLFVTMFISGFAISHYLNQVAESKIRATILSFRGLAFNLVYGIVGLFYAQLAASIRTQKMAQGLEGEALKNEVFVGTLQWFPWYFLTTVAIFIGLAILRSRKSKAVTSKVS